ncbi:MAG: methyltransferase domain-containing protein [Actinomycetota bacterium]|nr:methyltransferase domain-containing protein [Actinomycetota bacterium]
MSWDAETYDKVADPQEQWAREILARAAFAPGQTILDAGCGSGRVTKLLLEQGVRVVAVDADPAMVEKARAELPPDVDVQRQDLLELELDEPVDGVFSCAVFHWITDHERLFARLRAALKPGGRLVAQCGGHGNIAKVVAAVPKRTSPWLYATPEGTERRLLAAGFSHARAWLEPKPTVVDDPETYVAAVCLHGHPQARELAPKVVAALGDPPLLDYVRLNIDATA